MIPKGCGQVSKLPGGPQASGGTIYDGCRKQGDRTQGDRTQGDRKGRPYHIRSGWPLRVLLGQRTRKLSPTGSEESYSVLRAVRALLPVASPLLE